MEDEDCSKMMGQNGQKLISMRFLFVGKINIKNQY